MTIDLKPLDQQVIVVFGASSGIGRATALAAAQRGARVVGSGRDQAALDSLVAETASAPGEVVVGTADAADQGEVETIAELAVSRFGRIDTWAHVAGIAVYGPFEDITPEEFRREIDVDLLGPVHGARAALPHLRANGGAFVVVSSEIAKRGFPLATSYSAAKYGVDGFLEALRVELQHAGAPVSVTQVMPAAIATPFFENARSRLGVRASGPPPVTVPRRWPRPSWPQPSTLAGTSWSGARPRCSSPSSGSRPCSWTPSSGPPLSACNGPPRPRRRATTLCLTPPRARTGCGEWCPTLIAEGPGRPGSAIGLRVGSTRRVDRSLRPGARGRDGRR